jgi:OmpA-OmpF porin, OOP family
MIPTTLETKVDDFLAQKRIAVAGVSRDHSHHPAGNLIYRRVRYGQWRGGGTSHSLAFGAKNMTKILVCSALLCTIAGGAAAQSPGTFEVGGFGRYANFGGDLRLHDRCCGAGAYIGFYVLRDLALEGEGSYLRTHDEPTQTVAVSNAPLRARLLYNIPIGANATALQLGAGYVHDIYGKDVDFKNSGVTGFAGFRLGVASFLALRVGGTVDYVPSPGQTGVSNYWNWGVQFGGGLLLGNKYDRDHDGVKDNADKCPNTPRGEPVDANGCSASQRDTDGDGVKDNTDKCPNTPPGEKVDANGCSASQLDADGDGVPDASDRCPNTPRGEAVDASGCSDSQKDDDRDGVGNSKDKCPNTPAGEAVDANGCSESQRDADGDGVPDVRDRCPNTPAGEAVDANGCSDSQRDDDADGVPNNRDKCPNTPHGQVVDENGCPVLFEGTKKSVILKGVNFEINKAVLTDESKLILKDVATSLAARPDVRVEVQGHTDISGSRALNMRLSQARAKAVESFLEENGVSPAQLTAKGYGPDKPIATNKTAAGRAQNRRVELVRLN